MTAERRAEVNRRLAEFEWPTTATPNASGGYLKSEAPPPNYTADLNALARLEGKMPPHYWYCGYQGGSVGVDMHLNCPQDPPVASANEPTEAEARAEAICQWLEDRK